MIGHRTIAQPAFIITKRAAIFIGLPLFRGLWLCTRLPWFLCL